MGALIAKFDVLVAYLNVPVHPSHSILLGMKRHDQFYVDLVLPLASDQLLLFLNPFHTWWSSSLSIHTRFQTSTIAWMTSLLQLPLSPSSAYRTWLLLWKSVNGLVCLCILVSVWALLLCLLFSTLSTKWKVFHWRSC